MGVHAEAATRPTDSASQHVDRGAHLHRQHIIGPAEDTAMKVRDAIKLVDRSSLLTEDCGTVVVSSRDPLVSAARFNAVPEDGQVEIEWLILADAAQIADGKLNLLGGGWDTLTANQEFPFPRHLAVAAAFKVPWNETNQRHTLQIEIQDDDGKVLFGAGGEIEVGRPPGIPAGQAQRAQIALDLTLTIEHVGNYVLVGRVTGEDREARVPFRIILGPSLAIRQQQRPGQ